MTNPISNLMSLQVRNRTQVAEDEGTGLPEQNGLLISEAEASEVAKTTNNKDEIDLTQFLREVKKTPPHLMTTEKLASLAKQLVRNSDFRELVDEYVLFRDDRPMTKELLFSESVSILVVSMLPDQKVPPHDHGQSMEVGIVINNKVTNRDFNIEDQKLVPDPGTEVGEDGVFLTEKYAYHQILNNSAAKKPTISVHFHSPGWRVAK